VFILWNGRFAEYKEGVRSVSGSRLCSIMLISIPESERME